MTRRLAAAACVAAALVGLAACGDTPPPPSASELQAITLPSPAPPPNSTSDAGPCALLTGAEVGQTTGVTVVQSSRVGGGCIWQGRSDGTLPVADLQVLGDRDGDISRVYAEARGAAAASGEVRPVDGLGDSAFAASGPAPTVWWQQDGAVYGLSIMLPPGQGTADGPAAALDLARLASSRIGG